jgi:hypothetical protein
VFLHTFQVLILHVFTVKGGMEFKTRVKNESDIEEWEKSEAYDVSK